MIPSSESDVSAVDENHSRDSPSTAPVVRWLLVIYAMTLAMVVIGGITRLTGSGLSMVEWRPLFGALPPIGEAEWLRVFERYQEFPQYREVNHWMQLADFKRIFFWEYVHRLLGRTIGLVFLVPYLAFLKNGRLHGQLSRRVLIAFVLGGAQGLLGWIMVRSGMVDVPAVSHFRLAAHLVLAFIVGHYVLWIVLDVRAAGRRVAAESVRLAPAVWALMALVLVQIAYGAFMAGLRAGVLFPTFPTMSGAWIPPEAFMGPSVVRAALYDSITVHFLHRVLGYLSVVACVALWLWARTVAPATIATRRLGIVTAVAFAQVVLGVVTVLTSVSIPIAVAHQALGFGLLTTVLFAAHATRG